jgi:predicted ATPase
MYAQSPVQYSPNGSECPSLLPDRDLDGLRFDAADGSGERFRLDTANQCLWELVPDAADRRLLLSPKSFAVLKHLIDRAGRLVTHEEFFEIVWPGVYVQPEVLKSQIQSLRSVLKDDARKPRFIETLSRRGYRFIARVFAADASPSGAPAVAPASVRLVGREQPLSELRAILQRSVRQRRREMVFVTGETGIGKTSLVDAFLQQMRLEMPQARIALGQCVEGYGGKEAYYPMLEALRELCMSQGGGALARELASCAPSWLAQIPALLQPAQRSALQRELLGGTHNRMPRELVNLLQRVTQDSPVVLVFEDLQWADPSTISLIEVLARARDSMRLMLIGTYRTADVMSGDHALHALRKELQLHGLCGELTLEPLTEHEIAAYLTAQASGGCSAPEGLARLIYHHTEGNPLFMVTLLEHLRQRGLLTRVEGAWQLHAPLNTIGFEVPNTLREMIEAHIARLSVEEQRVLEIASIVGVEFYPQCCADAAALNPERTEEICHALAERHCVLRASRSDPQASRGYAATRYEFAHAMYREVLFRRLTPARRAGHYARMAPSLESEQNAKQRQPPVQGQNFHRVSRSAAAARSGSRAPHEPPWIGAMPVVQD